jgi:hypothetical protein
MQERFVTVGNLHPKKAEAHEMEVQAGLVVPSFMTIDKVISVIVSYADEAEQEQAEELVRELLLKMPEAKDYILVINSGNGAEGVGSDPTDQSVF